MATGDMMPVLQLTITGDIPEKDLNDFVEKLKDRILESSDIGKLSLPVFVTVRYGSILILTNYMPMVFQSIKLRLRLEQQT